MSNSLSGALNVDSFANTSALDTFGISSNISSGLLPNWHTCKGCPPKAMQTVLASSTSLLIIFNQISSIHEFIVCSSMQARENKSLEFRNNQLRHRCDNKRFSEVLNDALVVSSLVLSTTSYISRHTFRKSREWLCLCSSISNHADKYLSAPNRWSRQWSSPSAVRLKSVWII